MRPPGPRVRRQGGVGRCRRSGPAPPLHGRSQMAGASNNLAAQMRLGPAAGYATAENSSATLLQRAWTESRQRRAALPRGPPPPPPPSLQICLCPPELALALSAAAPPPPRASRAPSLLAPLGLCR